MHTTVQDTISDWRQEATTLSIQELIEDIYDDSLVLEWNEICALEFMKRFEQVHKQKKNNNEKAMQGV